MRINFIPKTILGKWAVCSIIIFFLLFTLMRLLVASGQQGGQTFFSNPLLAFTGIFAAIFAVAAFFIGIFSIIKSKERAVLVFLSIAIGFLILFFILGEFLSPH